MRHYEKKIFDLSGKFLPYYIFLAVISTGIGFMKLMKKLYPLAVIFGMLGNGYNFTHITSKWDLFTAWSTQLIWALILLLDHFYPYSDD